MYAFILHILCHGQGTDAGFRKGVQDLAGEQTRGVWGHAPP